MITIHKYPLEIADAQSVEMPARASVLSVQLQNGELCLWALVDTCQKPRKRVFLVVGTGQPLPLGGEPRFIATVQQGPFVRHIFERIAA